MSVSCRRCRHRYNPHQEDWALVTRHEKINRHGGFYYLCEDCAEGLAAWVGIAPDVPVLPAPISPPFSHYEEP